MIIESYLVLKYLYLVPFQTPPHPLSLENQKPGNQLHEILDSNGKFIDMIPLPENPTNVTFGYGPTAKILYVTVGKSLYQIRVNAKGFIQAFQN